MEDKMAPKYQGLLIGFAITVVTRLIVILLPSIPSNALLLGGAAYGCGAAWWILRWSYRLANRLPREEGIPAHMRGVLIGCLVSTGIFTINSVSINPPWLNYLVGGICNASAALGVLYWTRRKPPQESASS
jgi:hypothetical protein